MLAPKGRSIKGQMRYANSCNARFILVIGEKELEENSVSIKNLNDSSEIIVDLTPGKILEVLKEK